MFAGIRAEHHRRVRMIEMRRLSDKELEATLVLQQSIRHSNEEHAIVIQNWFRKTLSRKHKKSHTQEENAWENEWENDLDIFSFDESLSSQDELNSRNNFAKTTTP